jgi:hypothetical protein
MSSMSAEALEAFDLPGYAKRHGATLTFPEKVSDAYVAFPDVARGAVPTGCESRRTSSRPPPPPLSLLLLLLLLLASSS